MPPGYKKKDVVFHSCNSKQVPSIDVKVHFYPHPYRLVETYGISEELAEAALGIVYEHSYNLFWYTEVPRLVYEHLEKQFGPGVQWQNTGHSGGWLSVDGIGTMYDVEVWWNALHLTAWYAFENEVKATVKAMTSWDYVHQEIQELDAIGRAQRGEKPTW